MVVVIIEVILKLGFEKFGPRYALLSFIVVLLLIPVSDQVIREDPARHIETAPGSRRRAPVVVTF